MMEVQYPLKFARMNLSAEQIHILLKVQDPGFYSHHGIDLTTPGAGLTTITQALVKKALFQAFQIWIQKAQTIFDC